MKVREMLKIQSAFENKTIPYDLLEEENYYWSKSKEEYVKILDLDFHHLIRIVINSLEEKEKPDKINILDSLNAILQQTDIIRKEICDKT
jgi:hypothetical protein